MRSSKPATSEPLEMMIEPQSVMMMDLNQTVIVWKGLPKTLVYLYMNGAGHTIVTNGQILEKDEKRTHVQVRKHFGRKQDPLLY